MSSDGVVEESSQGPIVIADGPFKGWMTWSCGADPYETSIGPFYFCLDGGAARCAFQPRPEHLNGGGAIHGGALMSFADFALFAIAYNALAGAKTVTMTFNSEFLSAGDLSGDVEAHGDVLRAARSVVFVRGVVTQVSRPLLAFSGTLKKIGAHPRG